MAEAGSTPATLLVSLTSASSLAPASSPPVSLVCIPHAGAGVASFHPWRELGSFARLWAVRFPGRESRLSEPALTSIDEMADLLAPALAELADHPVVLFGHCSGALVAYATAARLARLRPDADLRLVLSSQPAPFGDQRPAGRSVTQLSQQELAGHLRALGGTPDAVLNNPRLMDLMEPAIRADLLAVQQYRPAAPARLPYDIVVIAGRDDRAVAAESLLGWRDCTTGSFLLEWFDGKHFFAAENGQAVLRYLADLLKSVR